MDDADAGRHDLERVECLHAPFEKLVTLAVAPELDFQVPLECVGEPFTSTCTEWSTTRSTGTSGSMIFGFLPMRATAERMAARSTSNGTPVKSCNTMRATMNGISSVRSAFGFQLASARTFGSVPFCRRNCAGRIRGRAGWKPATGKPARYRTFPVAATNKISRPAVPEVKCLQGVKQICEAFI